MKIVALNGLLGYGYSEEALNIAFSEKVDYLGVDAGSTDPGPFIVDIDTEGNNFFDELDEKIAERKAEALNDLGIDPSFAFTKLY